MENSNNENDRKYWQNSNQETGESQNDQTQGQQAPGGQRDDASRDMDYREDDLNITQDDETTGGSNVGLDGVKGREDYGDTDTSGTGADTGAEEGRDATGMEGDSQDNDRGM